MEITLIAAMGRNRVIGKHGALPWKMPQDLARYHALTLGKPLLIGRKTFEETEEPLPRRHNLVLSQNPTKIKGAEVFTSLEAAIKRAAELGPELMVVGGAQIYALALPVATKICLTTIELEPEGDAFFPVFDESLFTLEREQYFPPTETDPYPCTMRDWRKR
jgi:dihydrofolate reductase